MLQESASQKFKNRGRELVRCRLDGKAYANLARRVNYLLAGFAQRRARKPLNYIVDCNQPLIYISEPPRSGGTLLRSLLDGHPQCHVFPHELSFDKKGLFWRLDEGMQESAAKLFNRLRDDWTDHFFVNGIDRLYPFYFNRAIQKTVFERILPPVGKRTARAVSDAYMTSFFNAWVDYQSLYGSDKRYKVAFCPWPVDIVEEDVCRFFKVYPDGFRIHVVRDPFSWWASYRTFHRDKAAGPLSVEGNFDEIWLKNCRMAKKLGAEMPDRYIVLLFEDLLRNPEAVMQGLAEKVGIEFQPCLLRPAINSIPKKSNSTHSDGKYGFDPKVLERWKTILPEDEVVRLRELTEGEYSSLVGRVRQGFEA